MIRSRAVFIAATAQHTGKTSASLGIVSGLQQILEHKKVGFMKPVGQKSIEVTHGINFEKSVVDKDVPLFKELLNCEGVYSEMSPVLIPKGYTKSFLNGNISAESEMAHVENCFDSIRSKSDIVVCEGTGHVGVGSAVGLSNATVAAKLNIPMILVVNGGIGSTLDEFALNAQFCQSQGATIGGVILNKVKEDKVQDMLEYTGAALEKWFNVPLLGVVPDFVNAAYPAVLDFEKLGMRLYCGHEFRVSHRRLETVLTGKIRFAKLLKENQDANKKSLYIIHQSREDLMRVFEKHLTIEEKNGTPKDRLPGLLVVGVTEPEFDHISDAPGYLPNLERFGVPILATKMCLESVKTKLKSYTAKLNVSDEARTKAVAKHYASHIDFEAILRLVGVENSFDSTTEKEEILASSASAFASH